jgi:hypothetical protein
LSETFIGIVPWEWPFELLVQNALGFGFNYLGRAVLSPALFASGKWL